MSESARAVTRASTSADTGFVRAIGLFDGTMIVVGSMIGSGIFIVAADIARQTGSPGGLLSTWIITGLLTVSAALAYGELAAMMPRAGGQYVFLREAYSPLWGFLYGWTLFLVIQTGTIAAVAVGFARYLGVFAPAISPTAWIIPPIALSGKYAISLSWQQLVAVIMILLITFLNTLGVRLGKLIQNIFTSAKTLSLAALILLGIFVGRNAAAMRDNFGRFWEIRGTVPLEPGADFLKSLVPAVTAASGAFGLFVAFGVAQVGSLFSADAWNNITFTAGEVKNPKRDVALSMAFGTIIVITLYCLANVAYLMTLPLAQIQNAPDDRVATALLSAIFGYTGAYLMAGAIVISTFGCNNGLIMAGARVYYAMARDGLFFKSTGELNDKRVPARALVLQGLWTAFLVLPRTRLVDGKSGVISYGNLYNDLLDYVVFSVLLFYILTIAGIFVLRRKRPAVERPYKALGYPVLPALYIIAASAIMLVLLLYKTQTTWPGLLIVLLGVPVYWMWSRRKRAQAPER
ncbi:MAG TPA: amino acid permease [Candidatus Dormibacteraeota bacterium]|nr:amino acid permease [Candidatus Dormibacteraeota bacterium]